MVVIVVEYTMQARESDVVVDKGVDYAVECRGNSVERTLGNSLPLTRKRCNIET